MDRYYVYYYRTKAKVADMRVFTTLGELEDWLFRTKQLNNEDVIITDIIADSRKEKLEKLETYLENQQRIEDITKWANKLRNKWDL